MRKELTNEWKARGIEQDKDYAILTNELTQAWSGLTVQEYKQVKGLKKENLRDNMTNIELVLNMLAEVTATALSRKERTSGMPENIDVARRGGRLAKQTRKGYEELLGESVVSSLNAKNKPALEKQAPKSDDDDNNDK